MTIINNILLFVLRLYLPEIQTHHNIVEICTEYASHAPSEFISEPHLYYVIIIDLSIVHSVSTSTVHRGHTHYSSHSCTCMSVFLVEKQFSCGLHFQSSLFLLARLILIICNVQATPIDGCFNSGFLYMYIKWVSKQQS